MNFRFTALYYLVPVYASPLFHVICRCSKALVELIQSIVQLETPRQHCSWHTEGIVQLEAPRHCSWHTEENPTFLTCLWFYHPSTQMFYNFKVIGLKFALMWLKSTLWNASNMTVKIIISWLPHFSLKSHYFNFWCLLNIILEPVKFWVALLSPCGPGQPSS